MISSVVVRLSRWILLLAALGACTPGGGANFGARSGSSKNDNFEEPIPATAARFAPLLERSNELVAMFRDRKLREIYDLRLDASLKNQMTYEQLERMNAELVSHAGPFSTFLPKQWNFRAYAGSKGKWVTSKKIVSHERGTIYYGFTFANEHATKLIGLHLVPRPNKGPYGL
jgi:hypothetical protein